MQTLPNEVKGIILDYLASMNEYDIRHQLHMELHLHFARRIWCRINQEFMFIFYPGFYSDLQMAGANLLMPYEGDEADTDTDWTVPPPDTKAE